MSTGMETAAPLPRSSGRPLFVTCAISTLWRFFGGPLDPFCTPFSQLPSLSGGDLRFSVRRWAIGDGESTHGETLSCNSSTPAASAW